MRAENLAFAIVYMLHEASCNRQFIPVADFKDVLGESEVSTLIKMLRSVHIIITEKEFSDVVARAKAALHLTENGIGAYADDFPSSDGDDIIALNPALVDEMKRNYPGQLGYQMVRRFVSGFLGRLETCCKRWFTRRLGQRVVHEVPR